MVDRQIADELDGQQQRAAAAGDCITRAAAGLSLGYVACAALSLLMPLRNFWLREDMHNISTHMYMYK